MSGKVLVKTIHDGGKIEKGLDDAIVALSSIIMVVASAAPAGWAAYKTYQILLELRKWRRRGGEDREKEGEKENEEAEKDPYRTWKRAAAVAVSVILYRAFINSRASQKYRTWFKNLPLWQSYFRYVDYAIVDGARRRQVSPLQQKVLAIVPHGLMPYPLALAAASPEAEHSAFGRFRVVAATATKILPGLATFIRSIDGVDASRASVDEAMAAGQSVAVAPGGIEEMFVGYPSSGWVKREEGALLSNRKGFLRLCAKHGVPAVPVFAFGASKMMRRLNVPGAEALSKLLRASVIVIYGRLGLPIPFRTRLWYVMGDPIWPREGRDVEENVEEMHGAFCDEIYRVFNEYKGVYDDRWDDKELRVV